MRSRLNKFIGTELRPIELANFIKKLLRIDRKLFSIDNIVWYLDPVSNFGIRLLKSGQYEPKMKELILDKLNVGDIFIDLGGNEGYFSILASKRVGNAGKVFCVEPQERLWSVILRNINENSCYNVKLIPFAVSDNKNKVSITLSPSINTGSSSIVRTSRKQHWKNQVIQTVTLDDLFFDSHTSIKLMKVDIEGYEMFALKGASKLLENKVVENIIVEFHPVQLKELGQSVDQIKSFFKQYGYSETDGVFTYN